jgi:hypothetical protein
MAARERNGQSCFGKNTFQFSRQNRFVVDVLCTHEFYMELFLKIFYDELLYAGDSYAGLKKPSFD